VEDPLELFDWDLNWIVFDRVAENVYIRASKIVLEALREIEEFKVTFSISGIALELMRRRAPQALELLRDIASTGRAEFMAQTYYHSLAWFIDIEEFTSQI
jgi:alpha-amylase